MSRAASRYRRLILLSPLVTVMLVVTRSGVTAGTQVLSAGAVGYAAVDTIIDLPEEHGTAVDFTLSEAVRKLEEVEVETHLDSALRQAGFFRRKASARGKFLTAEEIAKKPLRGPCVS